MKYLKKAQQLLQKTYSRHVRGLAHHRPRIGIEGKRINNNDFSAWNGAKQRLGGHLTGKQMQQALFLADDVKWAYFKQRGETGWSDASYEQNGEHDTRPMTDGS